MADECDPLFDIRDGIVEKLTKAQESITAAQDNIARATMALAGAEGAAGACLFLGPTPAAAACGAAAAAAIAAAALAVAYYEEKLEQATTALGEAQQALDRVDGLISHCQDLQAWQVQARDDLIAQAPNPDGIADAEDIDSSLADTAEEMASALEATVGEPDPAYA